jgi:hypothetical protein
VQSGRLGAARTTGRTADGPDGYGLSADDSGLRSGRGRRKLSTGLNYKVTVRPDACPTPRPCGVWFDGALFDGSAETRRMRNIVPNVASTWRAAMRS